MADISPASVPLVTTSGEIVGHVLIDQPDLDRLHGLGVVNNWFLGNRKDHVLVTRPSGKVSLVSVLIMCPRDYQMVVYKDGNPLNLTRDNLTLAERKVIDILVARQKREMRK